ncbi:hypothetical protein K523DRAFT_414967 [Schizophyllum commune Tattone D]|nr:hypothetical protein K523DRAFT_414967 [Schizophyllum commune Tattone D]
MSELAAMGSDASSIFITRALAPVYTPHADLRTALSSTEWNALLRTLNTPHRRKELRQLVNLLLRAFLADRFERTVKARRVKRVAKGEVEGDDAVEDGHAVADEALFEGWMTAMLSPLMLANMFACSAILPPDLAAKAVELGVDVPLPNQIAVDIFLCFLHEINTKSSESLRLFLDTLYAPLLQAVLEDRTRSRLRAREMRNKSLTARHALTSRRASAPSGLARPADFNLAKAPCFDSSGLLVLDRDFACSIRSPAAAPPATTTYASSSAIAHLEPTTPALCAFRGQWNTLLHVLCSTRNRVVYSPMGSTHNEDESDTSDRADSDSGSDADSSTDLAAFLFCVDDGRHDFPQLREGCLNDVRDGIVGLYGDICAGLYDHRNPCVRKFLRALGLANSVACEDLLRQTDLDFQVPVKLLVEEPRKIAKKNAVAGDSSAINEYTPRTTDPRVQTSAPEARKLSNVRSLPASSARISTTTPAFATSSATPLSFLTASARSSAPSTRPSATPPRSSSTSSRSSATSALSAASSWMPATPTPVSDLTTPRSFFGFTTPKPLASTGSRIPPGATPTPIALVGVPSALGEAPLTPSDLARTRTPSSSAPDPSTLAAFDPASFASTSTPAAKAFRPAASTSTTFPSTSTADSCGNLSMPELSQADLLKRGRQALRPVRWDDTANVSCLNAPDFGKRKRTVSCGERSIDIGGRASSVKERTALFEQRAASLGGQTHGAGSRASGPSMSTPHATERTPSLGRPMLYASQRMPSTSGRVRTLSARAASEDERVALFRRSITILDVSAATPTERTPTRTERAPDVAEDALDAKRVGTATRIIQRITKGSASGYEFDDARPQAQGEPRSLGKRKRQASQSKESQVKQSPGLPPHVVPFALSAESWNALDEVPADPAKTKRWLSSAKIRFYVYMCDLLSAYQIFDGEFGKAWLNVVTSRAHLALMFNRSAIMRPDLAASQICAHPREARRPRSTYS